MAYPQLIFTDGASRQTNAELAGGRCLLIGPYDPKCGEYTFLSPPLGVWRLVGHLQSQGVDARVFDPNCCTGAPEAALRRMLADFQPHVVGVSTTGMTLNHDLALARIVRASLPQALLIAGGMEATFDPARLFELGTFDLIILGEGENPLTEVMRRQLAGRTLNGVPGTAILDSRGKVEKFHAPALDGEALRRSILNIPYHQMPYERYWERLEEAYAVGHLPHKAAREARLAEIRSVRLITLNYCPMGCSFCSSTNFLHEAEGKVAKVTRLSAEDCVRAIDDILAVHPKTRTIIFQDDIFVFTRDDRILPLCRLIVERKRSGTWPADLRFISTNRIDAMNPERLKAMFEAGFRVLGFGVESFSVNILREFNKRLIYRHIGPSLRAALACGVTPFLDLILSSPRCTAADVAKNIRHASFWLQRGCEIGMYPFVIPFSGSAMARDETLVEHTEWEERRIDGTAIRWRQPTRILPIDPEARELMLSIEATALRRIAHLERAVTHLPSRIRSLVWISEAAGEMRARGYPMPDAQLIDRRLAEYLIPVTAQSRARSAP